MSNTATYPYRYRNLPCAMRDGKGNRLMKASHSICGYDMDMGGGGVLEWCYGEIDALDRLNQMQAHRERFTNLSVQRER